MHSLMWLLVADLLGCLLLVLLLVALTGPQSRSTPKPHGASRRV